LTVTDAYFTWLTGAPSEKENLCLYGFPNEQWEVNLPAEEVPPELPEPALGINFARDGMQEKDWLSLVAVHSDAWLLAVAFYFGARFGFDKADRYILFHLSFLYYVLSLYQILFCFHCDCALADLKIRSKDYKRKHIYHNSFINPHDDKVSFVFTKFLYGLCFGVQTLLLLIIFSFSSVFVDFAFFVIELVFVCECNLHIYLEPRTRK